MGIEANEQLMTKAQQNAIQEAGKSLMQALKQHPEELSMLSQGTVVLGLHAGKIPVQLVQIQPNTSSKMETLELKSTQNEGVLNSQRNTNPKFKTIPLSMNSRFCQTVQNMNSSNLENNMKPKMQTPLVEKAASKKLDGLMAGVSKAPRSLTDSAHRFQRRQNEVPRQEVPRMPSLNGVAMRRGGRGSTREPPLKFTPNGLMTMTIPILTGCTKLRKQATKTKKAFCTTLESLEIAQNTALNRNRSQVSDVKNNEVRTLSNTLPPQCDALNLVSDDETTNTPNSTVPQSMEEATPVWSQDKMESVQEIELQEKSGNWLESLETMQPLLDAIEVLKEEESTQSKTHKVSFFGRSKITKGKRSKRRGIRKTGWIKIQTKTPFSPQPVPDGSQSQSIGEDFLKPRVLLDLESRNYRREPSLVNKKRLNEEDGSLTAKRKKSIPSFCPVEQANKGLDKTSSDSIKNIKESQDEDNALWEFLKQGCDTCTSTNSSPSPTSTGEKSVPCISVVLPESALIRRTSEFTSVGDKVWNRVKLCVDGMSQRYVESMIQQYSLCGFSAALISACSQQ